MHEDHPILLLLYDNCLKNAISSELGWNQPWIDRSWKIKRNCEWTRWAHLLRFHMENTWPFLYDLSTACWPLDMNLSTRFNLTTEFTWYSKYYQYVKVKSTLCSEKNCEESNHSSKMAAASEKIRTATKMGTWSAIGFLASNVIIFACSMSQEHLRQRNPKHRMTQISTALIKY